MKVKELIGILRDEPENADVYIGWDRVNTAGLTAEDRVPYKVTGFRSSHRTADGGVVEISVYAPPEFNYGNGSEDEDQGEPEMRMVPVNMSHENLLAVLDDIRARVAEGDSFEGTIEYLIPDEDAPPRSFDVRASYRTGNSTGQGGTRMIGEWREVAGEGQGEPGNWYDDWEFVARTGDGDAVLKHRETEGLYRILPVEET